MPDGGFLTTFDMDGDPQCPLEPGEQGEDWASRADWDHLAQLRGENIRALGSRVTVVYVEGDTANTLKPTIKRDSEHLGPWEFWYQDSSHDFEGIKREWDDIRKFAAIGAVVVFDDVEWNDHDPHPFAVHMMKNVQNWEVRPCNWGARNFGRFGNHGGQQVWAQRRK